MKTDKTDPLLVELSSTLSALEGTTADAVFTCERAEALIAARLSAPLPARGAAALEAHLADCEGCLELARDAASAAISDALLDLGGVPEEDLVQLPQVSKQYYVRGHEVGRGGMGRIVRARDRRLGRAVAIKELLDDRLADRFEREARLTARLQHPGIVGVLEAGRWEDGAPFYAMKYVAGRPLSEALAEEKTLAGRLRYLANLIAAVDAIAYAHSERVIHRDLKPHNILIGPFGETVVVDWGLAKDLTQAISDIPLQPYRDGGEELTRAGAGTPRYMPPEQARGQDPDERADVFALGATLFHLLAGKAPDEPISMAVPEAPPELAAIVVKAMDPEPHRRYADAAELAAELKRFQTGQLVEAHRYSLGDLARRFVRRHRVPVAIAGAAVALLAVGGGMGVSRILDARAEAIAERDRSMRAEGGLLVELARQDNLADRFDAAREKLDRALAAGERGPVARFLRAEVDRRAWPTVDAGPDRDQDTPVAAAINKVRDGVALRAKRANPKGMRVFVSDPVRFLEITGSDPMKALARVEVAPGLAILDAEVDASGERVAWIDANLHVHVYALAERRELSAFAAAAPGPDLRSFSLAFSPSGHRLAIAWTGEVSVWVPETGELLGSQPTGSLGPEASQLLWSPDGRALVAWARIGEPLVLDGDGASAVRLDGTDRELRYDFTADSRVLGIADDHVSLWSRRGRRLARLGYPFPASQARLEPSGKQVKVSDPLRSILVTLPPEEPGTVLLDEPATAAAFSEAGELVLVDGRGAVSFFDPEGRALRVSRPAKPWPEEKRPKVVAKWDGHRRVYAMSLDGGLAVIDVATLQRRDYTGLEGWTERAMFPTERGVVVFGRDPEGARRFELWHHDGGRRGLLPPGLDIDRVHFVSGDGMIAYAETRDWTFWRVDLKRGRALPLFQRKPARGPANDYVSVSPDGRLIVHQSLTGVRVWDGLAPRLLGERPGDRRSHGFSIDGSRIRSVDFTLEEASLWTTDEAGRLQRAPVPAAGARLRPDGAISAVASPGKITIHAGASALSEIRFPDAEVGIERWSPDGTKLVVTTETSTRLLDLSSRLGAH